ncbi:hypothetical protein ALC57_09574, partial [Trachymyrmex cornetzi]
LASLEEFQERDSGWALSRILNLTINVNKLNLMGAGCYVEVPRKIVTKRAVISVRTTDNAYFAWWNASCGRRSPTKKMRHPTSYDGQVDVLPVTKEKYISFTKHVDSTKDKNENHFQKNCIKLRFIDPFKFLSTSLDKLASYLDKDKLKITRSEFFNLSMKDFDLFTRKGVFPYEYIDCIENLEESYRVTTARIILQFVNGRHSIRGRLRSRRERMAAILHPNSRRVQRSVLENRCIVISRHFRKFPRKLCRELRSQSRALLYIRRRGSSSGHVQK